MHWRGMDGNWRAREAKKEWHQAKEEANDKNKPTEEKESEKETEVDCLGFRLTKLGTTSQPQKAMVIQGLHAPRN